MLAGLACLALLLLGGLYFISTLQPAVHVSSTVESTAIPSANPDTSTISPFPRLDNLAGHAMFAPLIAPASDSFPKVRVRQR
ncbi:hypothetical protein TH61_05625 [Rufibacter sp. DG15C]|nr:hypothetical protein TH61_05625 [Rufibacter sp. DG15C]